MKCLLSNLLLFLVHVGYGGVKAINNWALQISRKKARVASVPTDLTTAVSRAAMATLLNNQSLCIAKIPEADEESLRKHIWIFFWLGSGHRSPSLAQMFFGHVSKLPLSHSMTFWQRLLLATAMYFTYTTSFSMITVPMTKRVLWWWHIVLWQVCA